MDHAGLERARRVPERAHFVRPPPRRRGPISRPGHPRSAGAILGDDPRPAARPSDRVTMDPRASPRPAAPDRSIAARSGAEDRPHRPPDRRVRGSTPGAGMDSELGPPDLEPPTQVRPGSALLRGAPAPWPPPGVPGDEEPPAARPVIPCGDGPGEPADGRSGFAGPSLAGPGFVELGLAGPVSTGPGCSIPEPPRSVRASARVKLLICSLITVYLGIEVLSMSGWSGPLRWLVVCREHPGRCALGALALLFAAQPLRTPPDTRLAATEESA